MSDDVEAVVRKYLGPIQTAFDFMDERANKENSTFSIHAIGDNIGPFCKSMATLMKKHNVRKVIARCSD